ncbi:MAG: hypothetical protein RL535_694 [Pseudomonadota bacterium]|jgi:uncharacterized membrane protein YGL010W
MATTKKPPTRKVDELLTHYGKSHMNPTNEVIHFAAIPLIMLSIVGLMYAIHPWVAFAFMAASMVYYARLSTVFLVAMLVWSTILYWCILMMGDKVWQTSLIIFIGAWIAQFYGHHVEGKKPSFFEDIQYLWVGPLFVLSKLFEKVGIHW